MPVDPHAFEEEELDAKGEAEGRRRRFHDFDCPSCAANNPYDEAFGDGDEILCYYCGQSYQVRVSDGGRLGLREA
jgi:transcription elongation factor Elf1